MRQEALTYVTVIAKNLQALMEVVQSEEAERHDKAVRFCETQLICTLCESLSWGKKERKPAI